jgi:sulfhydrogenase subunit beta (sulfur reductase)
MTSAPDVIPRTVLDLDGLDALLGELRAAGYTVIGPTRQDDAIVYDEVEGIADLPRGWTDHHEPGVYRLERRDDDAVFGYVVGPRSLKTYLHPSQVVIWSATRDAEGFAPREPEPAPRYAFVGARPCEIAAMAVQDRVFLDGLGKDPTYAGRREGIFVVAVNCVEPGGTCFCVSMGTGPSATEGFDIALTEVIDDGVHHFVAEAGSDAGAEMLERVEARPASDAEMETAAGLVESAAGAMGRTLDTEGIRDLLAANLESPVWERIAERCMYCANCTMVCPTCFCATVEDRLDLSGTRADRIRSWDSCFISEFSYIHGGPLRTSGAARYRQWLTHKLGSWYDQFGTSGCVGCGRCITWCPVGIDITAEAAAIRRSDMRRIEEVPT